MEIIERLGLNPAKEPRRRLAACLYIATKYEDVTYLTALDFVTLMGLGRHLARRALCCEDEPWVLAALRYAIPHRTRAIVLDSRTPTPLARWIVAEWVVLAVMSGLYLLFDLAQWDT